MKKKITSSADMIEVIEHELRLNKITDYKIHNGDCGKMHLHGTIFLPRPYDVITFGTCFHEIGHVVLKHYSEITRYEEEYEAEMYAIAKLKEYDYYTKAYEASAVRYIMEMLARAHNRGHKITSVPVEIRKFARVKVGQWKKAKKIFVARNHYEKVSDIVIQFYKGHKGKIC